MAQKPAFESFTQNWNRTVQWAQANKIPYNAYYPVYQMDAQRALSGTPMSESERIRAIEASAHLNYSTALPTDNPSWKDIRGNAVRNAQDIFTGFEPTHLIPNVVDTFKNAVEHPSDIFGAVGDLFSGNTGAAARQVLKPDNILTWIPGVYDIATVLNADPHLSGAKGFEALAKDPITAVIDVLPAGRILSEGLGRTAVGSSVADTIGMSTAEMRKLGIWRVGGKLIKAQPATRLLERADHPILKGHVDPETGIRTPVHNDITIGDMWEYYKKKMHMGSEPADITMARIQANRRGTELVSKYLKPAFKLFSKLTEDQRNFLTKWSKEDFRPLSEKMADGTIDMQVRQAYAAAWEWSQKFEEFALQSGQAVKVKAPFKDEQGNDVFETYWIDTKAYKDVQSALTQAETDQKSLEAAKGPFLDILAQIDENDRNQAGAFAVLHQQQQSIYQSVQHELNITDPSGTTADRLNQTLGPREALPSGDTPLVRNLLGLMPGEKVSVHMLNALRDLFAPGGLLEQMYNAFQQEDWVALDKAARAAVKKFKTQSLKSIPREGRATLHKIYRITENLQRYSIERRKLAEEADRMATGTKRLGPDREVPNPELKKQTPAEMMGPSLAWARGYRGKPEEVPKTITVPHIKKLSKSAYSKSLMALSIKADASQKAWIEASIKNPPEVWRNAVMDGVTKRVAQEEKTAAQMDAAVGALGQQDWENSALTRLRQNERNLLEYMAMANKSTMENAMLPDFDHEEYNRAMKSEFEYVASLRARGHQPLYVHGVTPHDLRTGEATYDVYLRGITPRKPSATYSKVWGYTPSIYSIEVGMLQATKDLVEHDMMTHFVDQELKPRLWNGQETRDYIANYYKSEIDELNKLAEQGIVHEHTTAVIARGLEKFGLVAYSPELVGLGKGFTHPNLGADYYIDADLAKAFEQTITNFQFPAKKLIDRGTQIFRFSILGLSPRYTAHILFGGTFLVALRAHPAMVKYITDAVYFALHNSFSERTQQRFPTLDWERVAQDLGGESTQEGAATIQYHFAMANSAGRNWLIPEWLDRFKLSDTTKNRIIAAANLNLKFTRAITRAQKAIVYLDGAARAGKRGTYWADEWVAREPSQEGSALDAQGRPVIHPITGHVLHDRVRSEHAMSAEQAHNEGMHAVAEVMGDLRHMTPLERNLLIRVFPFYGWTKHILQYVLSYPFDHPWRAMILTNLALMDVQDQASGLPIRLQLLTFLGQPDQMGNVTALDTKSLNPLRDTANYASLAGLFESLNPAITGVGALVDPQISFAGQNAYPQITYNQLYGVATAGAGGNVWNAAEQFVPQLSALDAAFNLSGQYAYLKTGNPAAFSKKVFESLGLPLMPEHINLRQMAAKAEIARYKQSAAAAYQVATTGDLSAIKGYAPNALLPDPLNTQYNVTPEYLAALTAESEKQTGLPFYETQRPPPNPPL